MTGGCYQAPELAWGPDRRCRSGPLPRYHAGRRVSTSGARAV